MLHVKISCAILEGSMSLLIGANDPKIKKGGNNHFSRFENFPLNSGKKIVPWD